MSNSKENAPTKLESRWDWSKIVLATVPALVALGGVLIGAHFNGETAKDADRFRKLQDIRIGSYVDFTKSRKILFSHPDNQEAEIAEQQASAQIAIYGDEKIVHSIAEVWRGGHARSPCSPAWRRELQTYTNMRNEVFGATPTTQTQADLAVIILGCDIPHPS